MQPHASSDMRLIVQLHSVYEETEIWVIWSVQKLVVVVHSVWGRKVTSSRSTWATHGDIVSKMDYIRRTWGSWNGKNTQQTCVNARITVQGSLQLVDHVLSEKLRTARDSGQAYSRVRSARGTSVASKTHTSFPLLVRNSVENHFCQNDLCCYRIGSYNWTWEKGPSIV